MLQNLTIFDKKKLLREAETGIVNLRDAANREPQLFVLMANYGDVFVKMKSGELLNSETGQQYTDAELIHQVEIWVSNNAPLKRHVRIDEVTGEKIEFFLPYTAPELNQQIAGWLGQLANLRNRLKYMRDTIMTDDAEFDSLAMNIFGVPKEQADAIGQAVAVAVDAFAHAMYYSPARIVGRTDRTFAEIIAACNDLSAAVGNPVSLWDIDINI
jgi:hypothetical protein